MKLSFLVSLNPGFEFPDLTSAYLLNKYFEDYSKELLD